MKALTVILSMVAIVASVGGDIVEACGAKFLVATRAGRFQKMEHTARPAQVVIYQHSDDTSHDPAAVAETTEKMRQMLENVGHTVAIAENEAALRSAGNVDIVMMELATARRLRNDLRSWTPGAAVLPIAYRLTTAELSVVRSEFGQFVKIPGTEREMLTSVQDTYDSLN